jgi:hypothetical protein
MFKNFVKPSLKSSFPILSKKYNYDVFKEIGKHLHPPEQAIWIQNVYSTGFRF